MTTASAVTSVGYGINRYNIRISVIYYVYGSCAETVMTATISCNIICCYYYYRFVSCVQISRYELFKNSAYYDNNTCTRRVIFTTCFGGKQY